MKTQKTLLALALFITLLSFGQTNVLNTTGNVLIGTTTDNGTDKLQVNGTASGQTATLSNQFTTKAQLDLKSDDNNVVKLTGNQTKTGILIMNSSAGYPGAVAAGLVLTTTGVSGQSISLTNNGGGQSIYSVNNANIGINSQNASNGSGIYSNNLSTGKGIYSSNNSTGNGIVSNTTTAGTGFNYVGQNNGTNTFTVSKTGVTTASSFVVTSGTSSQFLKANGSIDSSVYLTGTGTSSYLPKFTGTSTLGNSLIFDDGTKIGIGTTSPQSKLQVAGSITLPLPGTSEISEEGISFAPNHRFNYDGKFINHYGFGFYPYSQSVDVGGVNTYMSGYYGLDFFTADTNRMRILYNGNVGIGTAIPDAKLTVNGTIHATEVKVTQTVPADYVFQKYYTGKSELKSDYVMPTLAEIEIFTKKNNHLPDVPSAQEIQQNGVSLGEMSNVLLQKVEELTLYIIKQNKDIEALKAQVTSLMAKKQ